MRYFKFYKDISFYLRVSRSPTGAVEENNSYKLRGLLHNRRAEFLASAVLNQYSAESR